MRTLFFSESMLAALARSLTRHIYRENRAEEVRKMKKNIPSANECWGKIQLDGKEMIHAADLVDRGDKGRDMTYIKVFSSPSHQTFFT
jgi:hypothetical protein